MKTNKICFCLLVFIPVFLFGQSKVTPKDIQEIIMLKETGESNKALDKISVLKKTVTAKDSLYTLVIMTSAEINMNGLNCEEAIKDNQELIKLLPSIEVDCQNHIGQFWQYLGEFDSSIIAYKRVKELEPTSKTVYVNLASTYNYGGKYQEAINMLNLNPNLDRLDMGLYNYAFAYFKLNKLDSAKLYIDMWIKSKYSANDFLAYKVAAQIYFSLADKKKSCEYIAKASEINETNKTEEQFGKATKQQQSYFLVKHMLKEIEETKKLKIEFCK